MMMVGVQSKIELKRRVDMGHMAGVALDGARAQMGIGSSRSTDNRIELLAARAMTGEGLHLTRAKRSGRAKTGQGMLGGVTSDMVI